MQKCPQCESTERQNKDGKTTAGSQRYECGECGKKYVPNPKPRGYSIEIRQQAVKMYVDGNNLRRIGRHLGVNHQSVANWVKSYAAQLPDAPLPTDLDTVELDELFTFVGEKKTKPTSSQP